MSPDTPPEFLIRHDDLAIRHAFGPAYNRKMTNDNLAGFDDLWDYNRPAETEARFRELLAAAGEEPGLSVELLTQIARAQGLQRRFIEANLTLDEAESRLPSVGLRPKIRYLLERGRVYNSSGDPAAARPYFEQAFTLAGGDEDEIYYAVDAAHMLAIVAPPEEALTWNIHALGLAEATTDERAARWRGSMLNNIGWTYHAAGDYPAALDYLSRALEFRREHGPAQAVREARWCVARVRRDLGEVETALAEQRGLLAEYEALGQRSGYVYEEIGECLLLMGEGAAARPFFAASFRELSADPWLAANEPERLGRLGRLGSE